MKDLPLVTLFSFTHEFDSNKKKTTPNTLWLWVSGTCNWSFTAFRYQTIGLPYQKMMPNANPSTFYWINKCIDHTSGVQFLPFLLNPFSLPSHTWLHHNSLSLPSLNHYYSTVNSRNVSHWSDFSCHVLHMVYIFQINHSDNQAAVWNVPRARHVDSCWK